MLTELFSYDPSAIEPEHRDHMARILKARTEYMRAAAEVIDYRARAWAGEEGLEDVAGLKAADLTKVREDYFREMRELVKASVNVEGLMDMVPMLVVAVLQNFKIPLPVVLEAMGIDLDQLKLFVEQLKKLIDD